MDPNASLAHLRKIVQWFYDGEADASDLGNALLGFEALDNWLSRGGFLPDAWRPQSRVDELKSRGGF